MRKNFIKFSILNLVVFSLLMTHFIQAPMAFSETTRVVRGPNYFLKKKEFYEYENLQEAAEAMRNEAATLGLDIFEIPFWNENGCTPRDQETLSVKLSSTYFKEIQTESSFLDTLQSDISKGDGATICSVILVIKRPLSIDETASLFEKNVRFKARFGYTIILSARKDALLELSKSDYFFWIDDYKAEYKRGYTIVEETDCSYRVKLFAPFDQNNKDQLLALGVKLLGEYPKKKQIHISGKLDQVKRVLEFPWVQGFFPCSVPVFDRQGNNNNGKEEWGPRFTAQDSRTLVGVDDNGNEGFGVTLGILEESIDRGHDAFARGGGDRFVNEFTAPEENRFHGTAITAIAVGGKDSHFCLDGDIQGVAPRADIWFIPKTGYENWAADIEKFAENNVMVSNRKLPRQVDISKVEFSACVQEYSSCCSLLTTTPAGKIIMSLATM